MFGFQVGETPESLCRKRGHMRDAQHLWPFLTNFLASTVHDRIELVRLVADRTGRQPAEAEAEVEAWMNGRTF